MPIAVQCSGCGKGMGVPEKYAGRTVKCPKCKAPLEIPAGGESRSRSESRSGSQSRRTPSPEGRSGSRSGREQSARRKSSSRRRQTVPDDPPSDSDFLNDLDLDRLHGPSSGGEICPKCAEPFDGELDVCPNCGYSRIIGDIDQAFLKKKRMKGPDPDEFYKQSIGDSKEFAMTNFLLVKKTAIVWTALSVLAATSFFMMKFASGLPTKTFWLAFMSLCIFGVAGWFWSLGGEVVKLTMRREEVADRLHVDFFATLAIGIRAVIWPFLMAFPIWPIVFIVATVSVVIHPLAFLIVLVGTYLGLYALFPIAQVHRQQRYNYKSSILWELLKLVPPNFGPLAFVLGIALLCVLPIAGLAAVIHFYGGGISPVEKTYVVGATEWLTGHIYELLDMRTDPSESWIFKGIWALLTFLLAFPAMALVTLPAAFPAVFLMRLNGLFGLFRARKLGLVNKLAPGTPATFWVRVLASLVELIAIPFTSFLVVKEKKAIIIAQLLNALGGLMFYYQGRSGLAMLGPVWTIYNLWMYFSVSESTTSRATIGKETYGLVVVPDAPEGVEKSELGQLTLGGASKRFAVAFIGGPLQLITVPFHDEKKSIADILTNTRVVFRGDR